MSIEKELPKFVRLYRDDIIVDQKPIDTFFATNPETILAGDFVFELLPNKDVQMYLRSKKQNESHTKLEVYEYIDIFDGQKVYLSLGGYENKRLKKIGWIAFFFLIAVIAYLYFLQPAIFWKLFDLGAFPF